MKLVVLVDNTTIIDQYYLGEPGLSIYIEVDNHKVLFDTGYSDVFIKNADKMGIQLKELTEIVISHGHNDHTGGLEYLIQNSVFQDKKIIAHPKCFRKIVDLGEDVGSPIEGEEIKKFFCWNQQENIFEISPNCFFLGKIPRKFDYENRAAIGKYWDGGKWIADYLEDDSALAIKTSQGIFIVTGCSHSGIANIIDYTLSIWKGEKICGIIGGFHMNRLDWETRQEIEYMEKAEIEDLYPCHCVSLEIKAKLMEKCNVHEVGVGMEIKRDE